MTRRGACVTATRVPQSGLLRVIFVPAARRIGTERFPEVRSRLSRAHFHRECAIFVHRPLRSEAAGSRLSEDAELRRKERGHRGVRPRHHDPPRRLRHGEEGSSKRLAPRRFMSAAGSGSVPQRDGPARRPLVLKRDTQHDRGRSVGLHERPALDHTSEDRGPGRLQWVSTQPLGTTGFDVVSPLGQLRVEVPAGLVKPPGKPYVRTLTSTPSQPR
jgi:hypothetical protein